MAGRHTDPATTAAAYCDTNDGTIALASAADLEATHQATAPVIAQLEKDWKAVDQKLAKQLAEQARADQKLRALTQKQEVLAAELA